MTENRKVTKYLENITDPKLQVVKGIILATEELSNSFDRAVSFASEYLVTSEAAAKKKHKIINGLQPGVYSSDSPRRLTGLMVL
jgi:hypothetical protein